MNEWMSNNHVFKKTTERLNDGMDTPWEACGLHRKK